MASFKTQKSRKPAMLSFLKDIPNLISLSGLLCAVAGIYYAVLGNFKFALVGALWAVLFDWADGIVARSISGRTEYHKAFGGQLDSLIDIVSFGVLPAVFLLSYGRFSLLFLPGAFVIAAAAAVRLSYFNVFGLIDNKTYRGLALDNNIFILAFAFLFEHFIGHTVFSIVLYILLLVLAAFNLSSIRTPKFSGKWFYVLIVYTVFLTFVYVRLL